MPNIAAYMARGMLDWCLGGAVPTQPTARYAALSLGTPSSVSGSEVLPNSGYLRQAVGFAAADSPAGSASNTHAFTFGPFPSSAAIQGLVIYDAITAGNMVWYGTLLTAKTVMPNDALAIATGSLIITLT